VLGVPSSFFFNFPCQKLNANLYFFLICATFPPPPPPRISSSHPP
jgi:hypothetical protein